MEVLAARERRAQRQAQLLTRYRKTLLCFTMNIAGPQKNSGLISRGFRIGDRQLLDVLERKGISVVHREESLTHTGCEGFYVIDARAEEVKALTAQLENTAVGGRLYDMDVFAGDGKRVDRESLGLPERGCLLCDNSAKICGRSRAHSVSQLQEKTQQLLQASVASHIAQLAVQALLCELYTTPKPGLVDCRNSGSHTDMNFMTFLSSAAALHSYFYRCGEIGLQTRECSPEETFLLLRQAGVQAEKAMLRATGGVNTHKGAVFTMGLLCGAAGRLAEASYVSAQALAQTCAAMTTGILQRDFCRITAENAATVGQRLFVHHGITGARGQAQAGFPAVMERGLPVLQQGLAKGLSLNQAGCAALLAILAAADDTNMIARSDLRIACQVREELARLLQEDPYPDEETLEKLDDDFIEKNLSPGGSADLLAATYFLHFYQ